MTAVNLGVVKNGFIDHTDKGILKFSNDPSKDYAMFAISPDCHTLLQRGASDRWFWGPVAGQANGTLAINTSAEVEVCQQLERAMITNTD